MIERARCHYSIVGGTECQLEEGHKGPHKTDPFIGELLREISLLRYRLSFLQSSGQAAEHTTEDEAMEPGAIKEVQMEGDPLISFVPPGDVIGAITAGFNAVTAIAEAAKAIAQDQTKEGRAAARAWIELTAPIVAIFTKLNRKLKIDPLDEPAPVAALPEVKP